MLSAFSTRLWSRQLRVIASTGSIEVYSIRLYIPPRSLVYSPIMRLYIRAFWRQFCAIFGLCLASSVAENSKVNGNEKSRKIEKPEWARKLGKQKAKTSSKINKSNFACSENNKKETQANRKQNIQKRNLFKTSKTLVLFALSVKRSFYTDHKQRQN